MQSNTKNLELPNILSKNDKNYVFLVIQDTLRVCLCFPLGRDFCYARQFRLNCPRLLQKFVYPSYMFRRVFYFLFCQPPPRDL